MNQNDKDALAAAMLIKAYCSSIDVNDCCDDEGDCVFYSGNECVLIKNEPEFWQLDKVAKV